MGALNTQELALVLRILRERRTFLAHLIEMQKSQRRRGLAGAAEEVATLETEHVILEHAIRKLWAPEA
jgi:hypothetical protein